MLVVVYGGLVKWDHATMALLYHEFESRILHSRKLKMFSDLDKITIDLDKVSIRRILFFIQKKVRHLTHYDTLKCKSAKELLVYCEKNAIQVLNKIQELKGIVEFKIEYDDLVQLKVVIFRENNESFSTYFSIKLEDGCFSIFSYSGF